MHQSQQDFKDLWTMAGLEGRVYHHVGIDFTPRHGDFTVIDEADSFIYEDLKFFTTFMKRAKIICLTGLVHERGTNSAEKEVVKHLGIKVFDDSQLQSGNEDILQDILERDLAIFEDRLPFIKAELEKQTILWHGEDTFKAFLIKQAVPFLDLDAIEDPLILRTLDLTVEGVHQLLVSTKVQPSMRGLDYRAPLYGILLIFTQ